MASLRSQLPDLEAVEPISPVLSGLGNLYKTQLSDPTNEKPKCLDLVFDFRRSFNHSYRPFFRTSPSTKDKNIWRTKKQSILNQGVLQWRKKTKKRIWLLKAGSEKQRKENKEKTKRQKLTETSFERFHKADDEGGTARDLLQHLRHLKQYRSEYVEYAEYAEYEDYATISFRICKICNNIVQNM